MDSVKPAQDSFRVSESFFSFLDFSLLNLSLFFPPDPSRLTHFGADVTFRDLKPDK
jgi:hypothetical protein